MAQLPTPYRFRVIEYHEMARAGILTEDDRVELLEGIIVAMPPIGSRHAWCVSRLTRLFTTRGRESVIVWTQNPIILGDDSEPQPDVSILHSQANTKALPNPAEVLLVVEVADSSGGYDRSTKGRLYADAGIAEYWIVDLAADRIDVFQEPRLGGYGNVRLARRGEALSPINLQGVEIAVDEILG
jgi:Uma2 family endonuclease